MNLTDASIALGQSGLAAAGARTIIKRTLRKLDLPVSDDAGELAAFFLDAPWACTEAIRQRLDESVRAYERNDDVRHRCAAGHVEALMSLLDVRLDWPGLYPVYIYTGPRPHAMPPGTFCRDHYSLRQLWRLLMGMRAARDQGPTIKA